MGLTDEVDLHNCNISDYITHRTFWTSAQYLLTHAAYSHESGPCRYLPLSLSASGTFSQVGGNWDTNCKDLSLETKGGLSMNLLLESLCFWPGISLLWDGGGRVAPTCHHHTPFHTRHQARATRGGTGSWPAVSYRISLAHRMFGSLPSCPLISHVTNLHRDTTRVSTDRLLA